MPVHNADIARIFEEMADILEIETPFLTRIGPLQGFMLHHWRAIDALMFIQDLPDRACAAGQPIPLGLQVLISMQIVQDRLGSGCPLQVLRGVVPVISATPISRRVNSAPLTR